MPGKLKFKIVIDFLMTVILLLLMPYSLLGDRAHEWLGIGMFLLFVIHHFLNLEWVKGLARGKYTPYRIFQTVLTGLLFLTMIGSMISGILTSYYVFPDWTIQSMQDTFRQLHLACAYWGFVLMSLHIGNHWRMILGMSRKCFQGELPASIRSILRVIVFGIVVCGAFLFYEHHIASYLFLKTHFVMYPEGTTLFSLMTDYLTIMGMFIFISYCVTGILQRRNWMQEKLTRERYK